MFKPYPEFWGYLLLAVVAFSVYLFMPSRETPEINKIQEVNGLLYVHTDDNGCQYLSLSRGGLTPRMDTEGKQICNSIKSIIDD